MQKKSDQNVICYFETDTDGLQQFFLCMDLTWEKDIG
jgi:hypothetical protein